MPYSNGAPPWSAPPRRRFGLRRLGAAIVGWNLANGNLKELCEAHDVTRFKNLIFKHPFLGNIDGVATISFIGLPRAPSLQTDSGSAEKDRADVQRVRSLRPGGL